MVVMDMEDMVAMEVAMAEEAEAGAGMDTETADQGAGDGAGSAGPTMVLKSRMQWTERVVARVIRIGIVSRDTADTMAYVVTRESA